MPKPLIADCLADLSGTAHGFFTRRGGVSREDYASLNCGLGSKDAPAAVHENRARVAAFLGNDGGGAVDLVGRDETARAEEGRHARAVLVHGRQEEGDRRPSLQRSGSRQL